MRVLLLCQNPLSGVSLGMQNLISLADLFRQLNDIEFVIPKSYPQRDRNAFTTRWYSTIRLLKLLEIPMFSIQTTVFHSRQT